MNTSLKIIILAAGGSSRLGKSKQLLTVNNETLIQRIAKLAQSISVGFDLTPPLVVLGKDSEEVKKAVENLSLEFIQNPHWQKGMGSSISTAIEACDKKYAAVLLLCCDQVLLTVETITPLIEYWQVNKTNIIASSYKDIRGIPVIFPAKYNKELIGLAAEAGARKVIMNNENAVRTYHLPEAAQDLDTLEDETKVRDLLEHQDQ